jgi:hypothetical protein
MDISIEDFPFVAELPKREVKKVRNRWEELLLIADLVREKGLPVTQRMTAEILGVSKQRVAQIIADGRLETMTYGGVVYVTQSSLTFFAQQLRKHGRPTLGEVEVKNKS